MPLGAVLQALIMLAVVLLGSVLVGNLFRRIKQPAVVGVIAFGLMIGTILAVLPHSMKSVVLSATSSTMIFAIVILCIFVAIAAVGLFVAVQTARDPRRFQSPMTTWYAAMLFAVVPLRNALPGSPAFGSWIDLTIVLWVLVALVVSMLLYIAAWWRATTKT